MERCKAHLLRLSEDLSNVWNRTECVLLTVHCDMFPEKETMEKFMGAIVTIGRCVIRPVLEELLYFSREEVYLTPRRPEQWPFQIVVFVTRGGVDVKGRYWDDESQSWMDEMDRYSSLLIPLIRNVPSSRRDTS